MRYSIMHIKTGWFKPQAITCDLNMMENSRQWWCLHSGIQKNRTSNMTVKGGGYGEYQVPHQNFDWNHKTVTDALRPWPELTWRGVEPVKMPHPWQALPAPCPSWPRCHVSLSLFIISGDAGSLHLLRSSSQLDSPQPLTSNLPPGLIFPWVACVNQAQGLIDRSYRWWISLLLPIWAFSSDWETIGAPTISCACSQCLPGGRDATSVALLSLPFLNNPQWKSL